MITSSDNEKIKTLRKLLTQKKQRYLLGQYVVECVSAERVSELERVVAVYTSDESYTLDRCPVHAVAPDVLRKLVTTESEPPFLVVLDMAFEEALPERGRFVYADNIQNPGNLGTIIRTAVAFGYDGVAFGSGTVDPYSPKTVRSSAGYVTECPMCRIEPDGLQGRYVIVSDMEGSDLAGCDPPDDFVVVFGNEGAGVSPEMSDRADVKLAIPTSVDSLNVAVAAGVILYALRK